MKTIISICSLYFLLTANTVFAASNQAPDIDLPALSGNVQLSQLKDKVVYLDFWASWCQPCKKSFPWMNELKQKYADQGFEILAVNLDKDRKQADRFLKQMNVNFIVAFDEGGDTAAMYRLKGMPSSYLIGRDGQIHASHIGFRETDKARLEQAVVNLLAR